MNTFHFAHVIGLHVGVVAMFISGFCIAWAAALYAVGNDPKASRNLWLAVGGFVLCTIVTAWSSAAGDVCEVPHPSSHKGDET